MLTPWKTFFFIACCALSVSSGAQNHSKTSTPCVATWETPSTALHGNWVAEIDGIAAAAHLHLDRHPEWAGMVKGSARHGVQESVMVGDVNEGEVTLEESRNGVNISATWVGDLVEDSCATEIRGQYLEGETAPARSFILRKQVP